MRVRPDKRKEREMPQILVTTDTTSDDAREAVLLKERISLPDLESDHFSERLLERLGWALVDADDVEHSAEHPRPEAPPQGYVPAG
jgi:hypothetical protein